MRKPAYMRSIMILLATLFPNALRAEKDIAAHSHSSTIHFSVGSSTINPNLFDNSRTLDSLRTFVKGLAEDSTIEVSKIFFEGCASPEGADKLNERLSQRRRLSLEKYVGAFYSLPDSVYSFGNTVYEPADNEAYRQASPSERKMLRQTFARDRYARVVIDLKARKVTGIEPRSIQGEYIIPVAAVPNYTVTTIKGPPWAYAARPVSCDRCRRQFYAGLKTNMLYDAVLIPTLGAEVYAGRNISLAAQWSYAWWSRNRRHRYWRYYGGDASIRWWFGKEALGKPLTGHHAGIFAQIFTYDFEMGKGGEMGAKFNYGVGMEYGYSLPVARRINIDFTIGAGYTWGRYYKYKPIEGHYVWQSTHNRRRLGINKAEVSLVWLIGCGNYNVKGGVK